MNVEFRSFDADIVEVRSADSGDGMTFGGYAARYDSPSLPLPFMKPLPLVLLIAHLSLRTTSVPI
jgi:hypothetical protein